MRNTFANLTSVVGGEFLLRVANFVAAVLIARLYGAAMLGIYTIALAFASLVGTVGDNGLTVCSVSEASRRPHEINHIVGSIYATKTLLFAIAALVTALIARVSHIGSLHWIVGSLVIAKVFLHSYGQVNFGILKALDKMRAIGAIQLIHSCAILGGMAMAYRQIWSVTALLIILLAGQIGEIVVSGAVLRRLHVGVARTSLSECRQLMALSTPVGISCLLASVILRLDVLMVALLYPTLLVGHFVAANNGIVAVYAVATLFGSVLLPEMVKLGPRLDECIHKWARFACTVSIPAAIMVAFYATRLVVVVYGPSFAECGTLVAVMAFAAPLILLNAILFNRAIAQQRQRTYLSIYGGTALLAVALDFVFGRYVGLVGVAAAIVIREAVMCAAFAMSARGKSAASASEATAAFQS